jgi:hypothetical protein
MEGFTGVFTSLVPSWGGGCMSSEWFRIKVRGSTYELVKSLSEKTGMPMHTIVEEAVTQYATSMNHMEDNECGGFCIRFLLNALNDVIARPWDYRDYILKPVHITSGGVGFTAVPLPPKVAEVRLKLTSESLKALFLATSNVLEKTAENCAIAVLRNIQNVARARACLPGLSLQIKYWEVKYGTLRVILLVPLGEKKLARLKQSGLLKGGGK